MRLKNLIPIPIRRTVKEKWHRLIPPRVVLTDFWPQGCIFEITTKAEKYRVLSFGGEKNLLQKFIFEIRPGDIVFDIGSSVGLYTIHAALHGAKVVSFEPDPGYRRRLQKNIYLNHQKKQIQIISWAVSDSQSTTVLYTDGVQGNSPSLSQVGERGSVRVVTKSIDYAVSQGLLPWPNIVKIDIEGAEILALRGMKKLLSANNSPRVIYIEIHPEFLGDFQSSTEDCLYLIESFGYTQVLSEPRDQQLHFIFRKSIPV